MLSHLVRVGTLALACFGVCLGVLSVPGLGVVDTAHAQRGFDGNWSVLIVTERGTCDRAYRYGVTIRGGRVYYDGGVVTFSGRVASNGAVRVRVSSGNAFANGSGRLNRNAGRGNWSGQSGGARCSGYWTAERRS